MDEVKIRINSKNSMLEDEAETIITDIKNHLDKIGLLDRFCLYIGKESMVWVEK